MLELTYRCGLDCVHCYCKGSEDKKAELSVADWKKIIEEFYKEGAVFLTFTGGDPLIREDFLEIYSYAKAKGFLVTIFTNGQLFTKKIIDYLVKSPPVSIEITLNGITRDTYESITQIKGSFDKAVEAIKKLKENKLPVILKSNCLKQNKDEIADIKRWTEDLLGKPDKSKRYNFKYDPMIYPRLDGGRAPCEQRLSFGEIKELRRKDPDIWEEYQRGVRADFPDLKRDRKYLYRCNAWMSQFFIDPYGRLKFCMFTQKFSVDLKKISFKEGFYKVFPKVLNETFKTDSKCKDCELRSICYHCPARAHLETGDEEAPVPYYCELAKAMAKEKVLIEASK